MTLHEEPPIEARDDPYTNTEQVKEEPTDQLSLSPMLTLVDEYKSVIDTRCENHHITIIAAIQRALENRATIEEVRSCLNTKIYEFAGCVACRPVSDKVARIG